MAKIIFTKTQAVSALVQFKAGGEFNIHAPVDPKHNLFQHSCEELEKRMLNYVDSSQFAGVFDDPEIKMNTPTN